MSLLESNTDFVQPASEETAATLELDEFFQVRAAAVFTGNPFSSAISTSAPPSNLGRATHHLKPFESNNNNPIPTNKFYANLLLGSRQNPAYVEPYSVWQSTSSPLGMAVNQTSRSQFVYGPDASHSTVEYFFAPVGIKALVFGASEFSSTNAYSFSVSSPSTFSVNAVLSRASGSGSIVMPLVSGMGMVTGIFNGVTPRIGSGVGISSFSALGAPQGNMLKYELVLNSGVKWLVYVTMPSGNKPFFSLQGSTSFVSNSVANNWIIQVAVETTNSQSTYDAVAGKYLVNAYMTGNVFNGGYTGTYCLQYNASGTSTSGKPLVFAAPHHVASLTPQMQAKRTNITLDTPTLGLLTGYISTQLEMQESLPMSIGFLPYSEVSGRTGKGLTPAIQTLLTNTINSELGQDIPSQTNVSSTYFSGKGLDKFAQIIFTAKYILGNNDLALQGLNKLKSAFSVFTNNKQQSPLAYDTTWKGLVSTLGLGGDSSQDFGNTYYNDHHFHYGYFVHAAAVIAQVDNDIGGGTWLAQNKDFVNTMVRDVANPSGSDIYFPLWRSFDWYAGHSWAKGIFESTDGKDEESTSEDVHFAYGMKLWGRVIGDSAMEARGNLMLAVLRRSLNSYFLYLDSNNIMPAKIIGNKVSGILFENKVDHATYFGTGLQYIQGIHMIPVTSVSSFIRSPTFVSQEWNSKLSSIISSVTDGWRGTLMMNYALTNPSASLQFFSGPSYSDAYLDGGMSRTWALAYAAFCV